MPRRIVLALGVATVAALALGGSSRAAQRPPLDTAAGFFLQEARDKIDGDWNAAWRTLYPLHRQVASRSEFVHCERANPFPAPLKSLRVVRVRNAPVRVPGLARPVAGVAVDVHVELVWFGPRDPIVLRHTFHLVPVHGRWTWLLSADRYRLYRAHACTAGLSE
jgi:hypothetical protein